MKNVLLILLLFLSCHSQKSIESTEQTFPANENQSVVNDYSNLFSKVQRDSLTQRLVTYEEKTTNQIVIVTVDSITPYRDIQNYAAELGNYWGVGRKEKNNGLTIVIANKLGQLSIATGKGTEKKLTDSICRQIINRTIVPEFKKKKFYKGISSGLDSLIHKW